MAGEKPQDIGHRLGVSDAETNGAQHNHDPHDAPIRHDVTVSQVPSPEFTKLANPGPLGLIGFALTTFVLGLYQCGVG